MFFQFVLIYSLCFKQGNLKPELIEINERHEKYAFDPAEHSSNAMFIHCTCKCKRQLVESVIHMLRLIFIPAKCYFAFVFCYGNEFGTRQNKIYMGEILTATRTL